MLFSFLLSLRIAVILEKNSKTEFCSLLNPKTIADTNTLQNIYISPKPPFDPPKGGSSSFAPRHSLQAASALGLASDEKRGLSRFAPGAQIFRVSLLRSTANAVKIAKLKANKSLHANYSVH